MRRWYSGLAWIAVLALAMRPVPADAAVVVLANRTDRAIPIRLIPPAGPEQMHVVQPNDVVPVRVPGDVQAVLGSQDHHQRFAIKANGIYYLADSERGPTVSRLPLPKPGPIPAPSASAAKPSRADASAVDAVSQKAAIVPVMILVDEEEPAVRSHWEPRLRGRVTEASKVFEHAGAIRFEVAVVGTWRSDNAVADFLQSLREFERVVIPLPACLAIGFTSQYALQGRQPHLGVTRWPLYSHILVREWSRDFTETERLEVLVHELGHFLGAVHVADPTSVMRPQLGPRPARAREFRLGFDPVNTLILAVVGEELRHGIPDFRKFSPETKDVLRQAYTLLAGTLPHDDNARRCIRMLDEPLSSQTQLPTPGTSLTAATRSVVEAITVAATENRQRQTPLEEDPLMEHLMRRAALSAKTLPKAISAKAYLLGLGIGLDDTGILRTTPILNQLVPVVESESQRQRRLAVLGRPTMLGRRDLAHHFVVSAALAVLVGPQAAESAGILKEMRDAQGGSGFSFSDLAADLAGVAFAQHLSQSNVSLAEVAQAFTVADYMPDGRALPDGLSWKTFPRAYGSAEDERFLQWQEAIRKSILALPGYRDRRSVERR